MYYDYSKWEKKENTKSTKMYLWELQILVKTYKADETFYSFVCILQFFFSLKYTSKQTYKVTQNVWSPITARQEL